MAVAAGVCAVLSMNDGPHGGISGVGNVSGSLVFLFISAVLKVPAILGLSKIRGKPVKTVPLNDHPETLSRKAIGYTGEKFVGIPHPTSSVLAPDGWVWCSSTTGAKRAFLTSPMGIGPVKYIEITRMITRISPTLTMTAS